MKILVVDDSAIIRNRLVDILSALQGVEHVDTAARASEARSAIQSARPDVVVLDIHMPGGSGIEVLEALRADDQRIMTIVLTNDPAPQWRAASLRAGADFFFDKSAEFQQAVDVIARLALGRAAPGDPLPHCWACFERLPIPAWIFDVDTLEFKAVNDAAVGRFGYSREEFLAMTMVDIRPSEAVPAMMEQIARRRSGEAIRWVGMRQHRAKDGTPIHVEVSLVPFDGPGRRLELVLAHDISERLFDEDELRASAHAGDLKTANARLRALIDVGLELASERDADRLLQRVCVSARDLFGATYVTLGILDRHDRTVQRLLTCGTNPTGGVDAAHWIKTGDAILGILGTVVADRRTVRGDNPGGDPARLQLPSLHPDVQAFLAAPIASPAQVYGWICLVGNEGRTFTDDDEHLVMALSGQVGRMYEQITERNEAVEALRTAEERMRFALEAADVGIWDMDPATGVVRWSETLEAQYGLQKGTFGGTFEAFMERIHPDDRESVLETLGKAMKSGADFLVLNRSIWPDGTVRRLSGAGRFHLGEHGEPVRGVGISQDVTERNTLEEQFQQAQKMEAIGRLAGGVAHDFNNLLTVILGFCELLLTDLDPDDPRQADIAEIQKAGTRAAALTRQLLAFSRKEIIEPTLLDLNVVVADMRPMLERLIGEDVKVVLGLRIDLAPVKADRGQVEQIVMNLAVNARDAMPRGGTLTIESANVELDEHYATTHLIVKPGPYVALTVTDTGTGMTPQVQARLFEPFFTTKPPGKGTGLGLASVHGIVTRSGGSVNVYSEVGRGTTFKVYFPQADAAEMVAEAPPPVARLPAGAQTVLVVEDAEGLRELAKRLLERQGYTVLLAANADEARERFERNPSIDVLLTDVVMPGASGPELTRRLVKRRPALKVIYMSGYTEEAIVQHGIVMPGIAFLHKPFTSETLGRKLREVLDR